MALARGSGVDATAAAPALKTQQYRRGDGAARPSASSCNRAVRVNPSLWRGPASRPLTVVLRRVAGLVLPSVVGAGAAT